MLEKAGEEPTALSAAEAKWKRKHVRKLTEMREFIRMQMEEVRRVGAKRTTGRTPQWVGVAVKAFLAHLSAKISL